MAREEIRQLLKNIWMPSKFTNTDVHENEEQSYGANELGSFYTFLCNNAATVGLREKVRKQFMSLYDYSSGSLGQRRLQSVTSLDRNQLKRTMHRSGSYIEAEELDRFRIGTNLLRPKSLTGVSSSHQMEDINSCPFSELSASSSVNDNKVRH